MVRQLNPPRRRGWKGMLAAFVAAGAVAWQIMACVESPMSFSPGGDLAFTVMEPHENDGGGPAGTETYRLLVLGKGGELGELERSSTRMLMAPAYSPDGAQLAYLRVQLPTPEQDRQIRELIDEREAQFEEFQSGADTEPWISIGAPDTGESLLHDLFAGPKDQAAGNFVSSWGKWNSLMLGGGVVAVELVVRAADTGAPVASVALRLPYWADADPYAYTSTRLSFSPDGRWVYFALYGFAFAVDPSSDETRLVGVNIYAPLLSPDGTRIAALDCPGSGPCGTVAILETDGNRAVYSRIDKGLPRWGMAWAGNEALVALHSDDDGNLSLDAYGADGRYRGTTPLSTGGHKVQASVSQLAISPDGAYAAVAMQEGVLFLARGGQLLGFQEHNENELVFVQPTFTRDSRQVAFKLVNMADKGGDPPGATAIVFFTPEGRELSRVPIPRIPPEERPALPAAVTGETQQ